MFKCNQVLIKKRGRKGQTDRTLLAVYSSDEGRRDKSPPEALDLCGLASVHLRWRSQIEAAGGTPCAPELGEEYEAVQLLAFQPPVLGFALNTSSWRKKGKMKNRTNVYSVPCQ